MAYATILEAIPATITQGESVSWKYSNGDYPVGTWTLTYTLINTTDRITITATADGAVHLVEIPSATSAAYTSGKYEFQAHVDNGGEERYQVAQGTIEILTDFAAAAQASGYDNRSHVKKVLDALEAVIEGRASKTQMSQNVGGVQIQHMELDLIMRLRDKYGKKYARELVRTGKARAQNIVRPRFNNN